MNNLSLAKSIYAKAQPAVGPFDYRWVLLLTILAAFVAYGTLAYVAVALIVLTGGILLLRFPWIIWPLIGLVLPFTSAVNIGPATITDLLIAIAVSLWLIDGAKQRVMHLALSLPIVLVLGFLFFQICLLVIAIDLGEAIPEVVKWGEILLVLILLPPMVSKEKRHWVIVALLVAGCAQALLGIYQFIFQVGHPSFVLMERFMRASGTFAQPNPYAGYLGTLIPIGTSMALYSLYSVANSNFRSLGAVRELLVFGCTTCVIGFGLIVSWSRSGWLGTLIAFSFVVACRSRRAFLILTFLCLVLITVAALNSFDTSLLPPALENRIGALSGYIDFNTDQLLRQEIHDGNFAVIERLAHWKAAILMWHDAPLFGIGPGGYATAYPDVISEDPYLLQWDEPLGHAHNIYLNFLAETGLIGLTLYAIMMSGFFIWVGNQILVRRANDAKGTALAIGVFGTLLYFGIHNTFDNLYVNGIYLHLGFCLALLKGE